MPGNVCLCLELSSHLSLTFDGHISEQALSLPVAPAQGLAHIITPVMQLYRRDGEVQDPAVGVLLEGELAVKCVAIELHAPAVRLLGLALLVLQGSGVEAIPLQLLVGVIVSSAVQGHFLLLQGID